jgi:hypothetical protein
MKELQRQLLVALKSSLKAAITLGGGYLSYKLTGSYEISAGVALVLAPILKVIDPKDNSIGFNLEK